MAGRGRAFAAGLLQAREWPQTWRRGAWRQGLRRRCFDRAMSASCGKTSPANSVRQGSRGGRARRQSRWPGARFCGGSASGAGMATVPAWRQGLRRRCFDRAMNASCGKISPVNSVRQGGCGGRARRQSRWPGGGALLRRVCFRRGNGRRLGNAARIAALLRVGDRSFEEEVQYPECGGQYKARPS